jgi:hypothetical protein
MSRGSRLHPTSIIKRHIEAPCRSLLMGIFGRVIPSFQRGHIGKHSLSRESHILFCSAWIR